MRKFMRLTAIACAALTVLAIAAGSASAERAIEIVPGGPIGAEGPLIITEPLGLPIECEFRLRGIVVRQVQKVAARTLPLGRLGQLFEMTARECLVLGRPGWTVTFLVEARRPVQLRYDSFLGSLPLIEGLLYTALRVGVRVMSPERGINCLYQGDVPYLIYKSPGEPMFNRKKTLPNRLPFVEGIGCGPMSFIGLEGTFILEPPQMLLLL